jgi:hypothetical protein
MPASIGFVQRFDRGRRPGKRNTIARRRQKFDRSPRYEHLESRAMLTTFYVDQTADYVITQDQGTLDVLDAGDTVTWGTGDSAVAGLTFGTNAFDSLPAAVAAASGGDTIRLGAGSFTHSGQLSINSAVTIIGAGQGDTLISRAGSPAKEDRIVQLNTAGITFQSLSFAGWETESPGLGYFVWLSNADDATFDDVRFGTDDSWVRTAVYLGGSGNADGITITNSRFTGSLNRSAIRGAAENMTIEHNRFEETHVWNGFDVTSEWFSPIFMEYSGAVSGSISHNYFVSGVGGTVEADALNELYTIANYRSASVTAAGLTIAHNTFDLQDEAVLGAAGYVVAGVYSDPAMASGGTVTISDNIFRGYRYTGPQPAADAPLWNATGGQVGGALGLDGGNDFGVFRSADLDIGAAGSIAFWMNPTDVGSTRHSVINGGGIEVTVRNGTIYFYPNSGQTGSLTYATNAAFAANTWTHVILTWDLASKTTAIYFNGTEASYQSSYAPPRTGWTTAASTADKTIYIGRDPINLDRAFPGRIDDLAFFNTPLTAEARAAIYTSGVVEAQAALGGALNPLVNSGNLVAHWAFDESSGSTATDTAGGLRMEIVVDGIVPPSLGAVFAPDAGQIAGALQLDGVDDFGVFRSADLDIGAAGSIAFWMNPTDVGSTRHSVINGGGIEVTVRNGTIYFYPNSGQTGSLTYATTAAFAANTWTHVIVTWDLASKTTAIYFNGTEATYQSSWAPPRTGWTTAANTVDQLVYVGTDPNAAGRQFPGRIDDLAFFDTVLSSEQRAAIYANGVAGAQAALGGVLNPIASGGNLVAGWSLDDEDEAIVGGGAFGTSTPLYLNALPPVPGIQAAAIKAGPGTTATSNLFYLGDVSFNSAVTNGGANLAADPEFFGTGAFQNGIDDVRSFYVIRRDSAAARSASDGTPREHRGASQYPRVALLNDRGISAADQITNDGRLMVMDVPDSTVEYSLNNGISWQPTFVAEEGYNAAIVRLVGTNDYAGAISESAGIVFTLDTVAPTMTIESSMPNLRSGQTSLFRFTASELSPGFSLASVTATNGTFSNFVEIVDDLEWTAVFTPTADTEATATIQVAATGFEDVAGNGNTPSAVVSVPVDTRLPVVAVSTVPAALKAGETANITFMLSEPSVNFTIGDVQVSGGTLSQFAGSGAVYTATFTPRDDFNGDGQVTVLAGSFSDAIGNTNAAAAALSTPLTIRTSGPRLTIRSSRASLTNAASTSTITLTLNRPVTGIDATSLRGLLTVTGGTLPSLSGSGTSFTGTFTATPGYEGEGAVAIAAGAIVDEAGNESLAAAVAMTIDRAAPTLEITADDDSLGFGETAAITFTVSEPISGFIAQDVKVTGGKLINFTQATPTTYAATFVPLANKAGTAAISVAANRFTDAVGNANDSRELSPPISYNTIVPTVRIAQRLAVVRGGQSTLLTFTINGDPRGTANPFEAADISVPVGQGTIANLVFKSFARGKSIYTASYTAPTTFEATVPVTVPANAFKIAGNDVNGNKAATLGIKVDGVAPTVVSVSSDRPALNASETAKLTFTLSESSRTFTAADVSVTGGKLSAFAASGKTGRVYTATLAPTLGFDGQATVRVLDNTFTDLAGNNNTASSVLDITVDAVAPAPLTTVALENDTGFSATDKITSDPTLVVTGREPEATLQYSLNGGSSWSPTFAPAQGANTVHVRQVDPAGNPSAAMSLAFTYLSTAPEIVPPVVLPRAAARLTAGKFIDFQVTFSRAVRVTGQPFIEIGGFTTGGATRKATYLSGNGTTKLTFRYVVQAGDKALSGITIPVEAIQHQLGSAIADDAGNAAALTFSLPSRRPITKVNA